MQERLREDMIRRRRKILKKKIGLALMLLWIIFFIVVVYATGGTLAAWIWNGSVFVLAPVACIAFLIQFVVGIIRICKRKNIKWNLVFLLVTLVIAYPVTILFGCSKLTYPAKLGSYDGIIFQEPVEGGTAKGGKEFKPHAVWPSECYAYDIVKTPYEVGSHRLEDYGIYQADVKAPIDGEVIGLKDDEEDVLPNTEDFVSLSGNYIYIKIDKTDTYLILAHLEKDSINVEIGDKVKKGQVIAKVGNSGTTSEPHLHIQHQKENPLEISIPVCAQGLPIEFE